ncbi:MAG TPA: HDOD domain-containing protein [Burkholderiaceae bacterium]|nr:HDOD domain-containing protein [Burkholderiaceae bacterium]
MDAIAAIAPERAVSHLDRPLSSLDLWLSHFRTAPIPILDATATAIEELVDHEDAVDAHLLSELMGNDPLMTLSLLSHVGLNTRRATDVETVVGALVLMGISPFFRHFATLHTVSDVLPPTAEHADARRGLDAVLRRSYRSARFALAFAAHRLDPDAAVIHEAALLHDFTELLLWCHAPALALEIAGRQQADPTLRSAAAQRAVLGIELADLQLALMKAWRLPELLVRLGDDRHAAQIQVRNVLLAVRVARHSANGWDNPALPDDIADIGALLQLGPAPTLALLRDIDD